MSKVNRGKEFENCIRNALEQNCNVSCTRLIDPQNGYAGVRNICDFIAYKYPYQYFIECKSHHGNTLPFSAITENQWKGMLEQSKVDGVIAGVFVWFVDHDTTVFINITELEEMRLSGAVSLNIKKLPERVITISGQKKRIFFSYDLTEFFEKAIDTK